MVALEEEARDSRCETVWLRGVCRCGCGPGAREVMTPCLSDAAGRSEASAPSAGAPRCLSGKGQFLPLLIKGRGQLCQKTVLRFLWPHGEVSVEPEAWGEEVLSAGGRGRQGKEGASSAAGAGHGGQEAGGEDHVPGDDDQVEEGLGTRLHWEELRLGFGRASGSFPQRWFCVL